MFRNTLASLIGMLAAAVDVPSAVDAGSPLLRSLPAPEAPPPFFSDRGFNKLPASLRRGGSETGTFRMHKVSPSKAQEVSARVTRERQQREYARDPINCGDYETRMRAWRTPKAA